MHLSVGGFQLRCKSQTVAGDMAPSSRTLGSLGLLGSVRTARRLGSIEFWNGRQAHASAGELCPSAPNYTHLNKSSDPSDRELFFALRVEKRGACLGRNHAYRSISCQRTLPAAKRRRGPNWPASDWLGVFGYRRNCGRDRGSDRLRKYLAQAPVGGLLGELQQSPST
jgi:hypothetical protein